MMSCQLEIKKADLDLIKKPMNTTLKIGLGFLPISIIVYFNTRELELAGCTICTKTKWVVFLVMIWALVKQFRSLLCVKDFLILSK